MARAFRWIVFGVAGVVGIAAVALAAIYGLSDLRLRKTYEVSPAPVAIPTGQAALERGRHVARVRGCTDCHGGDLGGAVFLDDAPGRLSASNLTRGEGGIGSTYTDADWIRAIRHGVGPDDKPLLFMPSQEFWYLGDQDLGALIAYLKSAPPVDRRLPTNRVRPLGRALFLAGQIPLVPAELVDHDASPPEAPPPGPTPEYGRYLAVGCTGCHGAEFAGGPIPGVPPGWPPAANLTPSGRLAHWSEADFGTAVRQGRAPDGRELAPQMPRVGALTDLEVRAIWTYLQTLPPAPVEDETATE